MVKFRLQEGSNFLYFEIGKVWSQEQIEKYTELAQKGVKPEFFSGSKDSQGNEIYQGDKIDTPFGKGEVKFENGLFVVEMDGHTYAKAINLWTLNLT